jgi:hypothetical protein
MAPRKKEAFLSFNYLEQGREKDLTPRAAK